MTARAQSSVRWRRRRRLFFALSVGSGVEPAGAVRGAAGRARAASTSAARSRSGASPRSPPVPSARRRWAAVSVAFAGGSPTVTAGPADACWGRSACPGRILARRAPVGPPSSSRARTGHVPRSLEPRGRPCWRQAHRSVSGAWIASGSTPTARSSPSSSARSPERERSRSRPSCARSATIPAVSVRRARVPVPRWRERPHPAGTSAQRRPHALLRPPDAPSGRAIRCIAAIHPASVVPTEGFASLS